MDRININTASSKELSSLDGVGAALAKKIIAHRKKNGRFKTVDGLAEVSGCSQKLVKSNKKRLVLTNKAREGTKAAPRTKKAKSKKVVTNKKVITQRQSLSGKGKDTVDQVIDYSLNWIGDKLKQYVNKEEPQPTGKKKFKVTRGNKRVNKAPKAPPKKNFKVTRGKQIANKAPSSAKKTFKVTRGNKTVIRSTEPVVAKKPSKERLPQISKKRSGKQLTAAQINKAAKSIGVKPAAIRAVLEVESSGGGFLKCGRPKILFEGHIFWTQLQAKGISPSKHKKGNEDILYPNWTRKHYKGGAAEYDRLEKALRINREAALASASWGLFQVMGFNYFVTEYKDVVSFVAAQYESEYEHLKSFLGFVARNRLTVHLKSRNWARFAAGYNGKDYKKNRYDEKLEAAYRRWS